VRPAKLALLSAALLASVVTVSGCGSTKSAAPPPPRLTHAQFVAKANAICRGLGHDVKPLLRRFQKAVRQRKLERMSLLVGELVRPYGQSIFRMSRLRPPLRQERTFRQLIHLENKNLAYLRAMYRLSSIYDFTQLRVVVRRSNRVNKRVRRLGRSLGLTVCYP
jgi:hypothetical protein